MSNPNEWNLSELYSGPNDPQIEADMQVATAAVDTFVTKWQGRTDYMRSAVVLREALDDYEVLNRTQNMAQDETASNLPSYFLQLGRAIDQNNSELKGRATVIEQQTKLLINRLAFFELSLGQISPETQEQFLDSETLAPYKVWLNRRFERAKYDLSVEATSVLNLVLPQADQAWQSMVEELLSSSTAIIFTGERAEEAAFGGMPSLLNSPDPHVVEEAGKAMTRIMRQWAPIAEREINAVITTKLRLNRFCGYDRFDQKSFLSDDLDIDVVESMLGVVEGNFDLSHQFYDLKAQLMGRKSFAYHERSGTYGTLPSGFTFEQACSMLQDVLGELHPDFAKEFEQALRTGHIDVFPRTGKRGGAACWHDLITHPTYLLLNFTGQLRDIQTGAHEFGHYLNNLYMQGGGACDALTFGAPTPLAEVASTFMEKYILDAVMKQADDETRLAIMVSTLDRELASIFRQSAATRFEQELYRQIDAEGYLSQERIGELFSKHMSSYLGPRVSMDSGADLWWVYWGHFRYEFYNHGYTFAALVSKALQTRVDADPSYIDEYRRLLRTGRSQTTRDLLMSMGLNVSDGSVWRAGLDQFAADLRATTELAQKLSKI